MCLSEHGLTFHRLSPLGGKPTHLPMGLGEGGRSESWVSTCPSNAPGLLDAQGEEQLRSRPSAAASRRRPRCQEHPCTPRTPYPPK